MGFIQKHSLLLFISSIFLYSCKKDKVPVPPPEEEPTLSEKVAGHYKVCDTIGIYLYDMDIIRIHVNDHIDSLRFENFDNEFTFTTLI